MQEVHIISRLCTWTSKLITSWTEVNRKTEHETMSAMSCRWCRCHSALHCTQSWLLVQEKINTNVVIDWRIVLIFLSLKVNWAESVYIYRYFDSFLWTHTLAYPVAYSNVHRRIEPKCFALHTSYEAENSPSCQITYAHHICDVWFRILSKFTHPSPKRNSVSVICLHDRLHALDSMSFPWSFRHQAVQHPISNSYSEFWFVLRVCGPHLSWDADGRPIFRPVRRPNWWILSWWAMVWRWSCSATHHSPHPSHQGSARVRGELVSWRFYPCVEFLAILRQCIVTKFVRLTDPAPA